MNVLYRKIETVIYVLCLNLIGALWLLLHADMSIRDSHNVSLDTITLRQLLFVVLAFTIALLAARKSAANSSKFTFINRFLCILFIPLCIASLLVIGCNAVSVKHIIYENKVSQTEFNAVGQSDLKPVIVPQET